MFKVKVKGSHIVVLCYVSYIFLTSVDRWGPGEETQAPTW